MTDAPSSETSPEAEPPPDRRLILAARTILVLHRELEKVARGADVTIPQYRFLLSLKRGAGRMADLALDSAIGRPAASSLIADMERRGLIRREPDLSDGRSTRLRLTEEGVAKHAHFERELARFLSRVIDPEESEAILNGIVELAYRLDVNRHGDASTND